MVNANDKYPVDVLTAEALRRKEIANTLRLCGVINKTMLFKDILLST